MKREEIAANFQKHELHVIENTEHVQMFSCHRPDTGMYGFQVVCANNLISLTGDICTMVITPGYGRNGTKFLRGSVQSEDYFLGKMPYEFKRAHQEFEPSKVRKYLTEYAQSYKPEKSDYENEDGELDTEEYEEALEESEYKKVLEIVEEISDDDMGHGGEHKFYELWYEKGLDEPPCVLEMTSQTEYQLEALKWLAAKLDEVGFENGKPLKSPEPQQLEAQS